MSINAEVVAELMMIVMVSEVVLVLEADSQRLIVSSELWERQFFI